MKRLQVMSTITTDIKWEPQLVIVSPFKGLPDASWQECLAIVGESDEHILDEIDSIIESSKDDHVLYIVLAYVDDSITGFCLFNAWSGQTKSKSILLSYVSGLSDYHKSEGLPKLIGRLLVERTLQEAYNLKNHDTVKDLTDVYCIAKDTWAHNIISQYGFTPILSY